MRCLTLAESLRAAGNTISFICRQHDGHAIDLITNKGFKVHCLPGCSLQEIGDTGKYENWLGTTQQHDALQTQQIIVDAGGADLILIDHYALDARWESTLSRTVNGILVFDDLANRPHSCHLLCDQTLSRKSEDYKTLIPADCISLLGPMYSPIRGQFPRLRNYALHRRSTNTQVKRILVSLGGIDANNYSKVVLDTLEQLPGNYSVDLVLGPSSPHRTLFKETVENYHFPVRIHVGVKEMAELMAETDLAIGAAGTSAWERCILGLPTLLIIVADNQKTGGNALSSTEAAIVLNVKDINKGNILLDKLNSLLHDPKKRSDLSRNSSTLIDGYGCTRITSEIMQLASRENKRIRIRPSRTLDANILLKWLTHPNIGINSSDYDFPSPDQLKTWMKSKLEDPDCVFSIIEESSHPIGLILLDKSPVDFEFNIFVLISPEKRCQGVATQAILLINSLLPDAPKIATPSSSHIAAHGLLHKTKFTWTGERFEWHPH